MNILAIMDYPFIRFDNHIIELIRLISFSHVSNVVEFEVGSCNH